MRKNLTELAEMCGCSVPAVLKYIRGHGVEAVGKRGKAMLYETDAEPLHSYIGKRGSAPARLPTGATPTREAVAGNEKALRHKPPAVVEADTPLNAEVRKLLTRQSVDVDPSAFLFRQALSFAVDNHDGALLSRLVEMVTRERLREELKNVEVRKQAAIEQIAVEKANRLKLENGIRRGEYISLDALKALVGKLSAVHSGQLHILGEKLAETLIGVVQGGGGHEEVKRLMDAEMYNVSANIVRELESFLEE
jgi:hypothetical protein